MDNIEKINSILPQVFSAVTKDADSLKKFTAFTAKHIQYSLKNLLLFYTQCPEADYIMPGNHGGKVVVGFIPGVKENYVFYTLAPFSAVDVKVENTSANIEFFSLVNAIALIAGFSICQKEGSPVIYDDKSNCIYTPLNGTCESINELLEQYCEKSVKPDNFSESDIKIIRNMIIFLYYNVYPPDTQEKVPSIKTFLSSDNREEIFRMAHKEFKTIWEYMDYPEYEVIQK